jgi:hypothetical protein
VPASLPDEPLPEPPSDPLEPPEVPPLDPPDELVLDPLLEPLVDPPEDPVDVPPEPPDDECPSAAALASSPPPGVKPASWFVPQEKETSPLTKVASKTVTEPPERRQAADMVQLSTEALRRARLYIVSPLDDCPSARRGASAGDDAAAFVAAKNAWTHSGPPRRRAQPGVPYPRW